jgi:hypothetical protein
MIQIQIGILDGEVKAYLLKTSLTVEEVLKKFGVPFENKCIRLNSVQIFDLDRELGNNDIIIVSDHRRI